MKRLSVIFFVILTLAQFAYTKTSTKTSLRTKKLMLKQEQNKDESAPGSNTSDPTQVEPKVSVETEVQPKDNKDKVLSNKAAYCYINDNGVVYDLNSLQNENIDYRIDNVEGSFNFNFCKNAVHHCQNVPNGGMAFFTKRGTSNCYQLAGTYSNISRVGIQRDEANDKTTLKLVMPLGGKCVSDPTLDYRTTFVLECDHDAEAAIVESNVVSALQCENLINIKTKAACPIFNAYSVYRTIQENRFVFGFLLIFLGTFFCFFGKKFYQIAQMIAGGVAVTLFFVWLVINNSNVVYASWAFWLTIVLSASAGVIVMYFLGKYDTLSRAVFGALLGFVGGLFLYNLFIRFIQSNPSVVFWLTIIICIGIGIGVGIWLGKPIIVIATAVIGAYGFIRGISFMAGGFPDEKQVYELGQKGEWEQMKELLTGWVYLYLAGFLILSALGMFVQFKYFSDDEEEKKEKENQNPEGEKQDLVQDN
jgi:hypothetical protein